MTTWPQPAVSEPIKVPFMVPSPSASAQLSMNRKKILIVDDSAIILKTLSMKLKGSGYDVITAADGASAVSTVRRDRPDVVLLDITFPPDVAHGGGVAWDGFLIMSWLRRIDEAKDIPVIIITGGDPAQYRDRSLAAGAIAFFQKPINNDELLETVRQTIGEPETPYSAPSAA
jgi:CheY-like chemotaxis protein